MNWGRFHNSSLALWSFRVEAGYLGALAPNLREASQATFVITMPLMVPLFLSNSVFMQAPNGTIATVLSLFPLSAPVAMMARLSAGGVAWWQPLLAVVLLTTTTVLIVRGVACAADSASSPRARPTCLSPAFVLQGTA
jgi:ABC-2 type transport system permease protein